MASSTDRRPWNLQTVAREYHRRKNYASYTMVWHKTIEADIKDVSLSLQVRLLIAIRHYAWGNFSDWAVDRTPTKEPGEAAPKPMKQEKLAEILNTSESQISKACSYWKQRGQLRKDHQFLFPEDCISPSDSAKDSGVSFYSGKLDSPYLRFEESYLAENKQLRESITGIEAERKTFKAKLKESSEKLNKAKLPILSAWRDYQKQQEEHQTQENQQEATDAQNEPESTRLCACAQNENDAVGEREANKSFLSANQYSFGVVSNSPQKDFPTPGMALSESDSPLVSKPNKNRNGKPGALKSLNSLNSLKGRQVDVGQSVSPVHSAPTEQARLTDRQSQILSAIPSELLERLNDTPSPRLLDRIDQKLAHAPLQDFTERIAARWQTITALGILGSLADDVARAWRKSETDRVSGIPVGSERRSTADAAADLLEAKYGTK